jgi:hypothetical protein
MFGDDDAIKELRMKWPDMTYEEKVDTFLWKMVWFHHQKHVPGNPNQAIENLTKKLEEGSKASENLTRSISYATWVAAVIGGLSVIIAALSLAKEFGLL